MYVLRLNPIEIDRQSTRKVKENFCTFKKQFLTVYLAEYNYYESVWFDGAKLDEL